MAKLTLTNVTVGAGESSKVAAINSNSDAIETSIENTLSRNGASPNEMNANLDMNSHRILNLPAAVGNTEPVRKVEYDADIASILATADSLDLALSTIPAFSAFINLFPASLTGQGGKYLIVNGGGTGYTLATLTTMVGDSGAGGQTGLVPAPAAGDATKALFGDGTYKTIPGGGNALTSNPLSQFAATTSAQLAGVISDEQGTGSLVFNTSPGFTTAANPSSNDGATLGTTSLKWSDLFLADGGFINWNSGDVTITQSTNLLTFAGASSGYSFDALVDISGASSGQIKFPSTQNASSNVNTLDDYREGTWTPGFSFGGGTVGITYTTQTGLYTKIGKLVYVRGSIVLSSKGTSTGSAAITGLPFASGANSGLLLDFYSNMATFTGAVAEVDQGLTTASLYIPGAASTAAATDANFTNTSRIFFSGCYMVP